MTTSVKIVLKISTQASTAPSTLSDPKPPPLADSISDFLMGSGFEHLLEQLAQIITRTSCYFSLHNGMR